MGTDMTALRLLLVLILILAVASFQYGGVNRRLVLNNRRFSQRQLSMEYIPDGMSKEQWKKLKQKEAELGAAAGASQTSDSNIQPTATLQKILI